MQCMPGTGYGRRRPNRKQHGPIFFKQMVPSLAETSLGASGVSEGTITRDSARFSKQLVVNGNPDVVFKDSDGTGSVRLMTQVTKSYHDTNDDYNDNDHYNDDYDEDDDEIK